MNRRHSAAVLFAATILVLGACKKTDPAKTEVQKVSPGNPSAEATSQPVTTPKTAAAGTPPVPQTTPIKCSFEWIDSQNQPGIWNDVSSAFREELIPDKAGSKHGLYHYGWKKIVKMARCGDAIFVALEMRLGEEQQWSRLFQLYNFDLSTKEKTELKAKWPFYIFKFGELAHFDGDAAPDITFEMVDCLECEALTIFNSVRISPDDKKWALRPWQNEGEGIGIEARPEGSLEDYQTLNGIADFLNEGRDQLALWAHYQEFDDESKKLRPVTTMTVYGYRDGREVESLVTDQVQMQRIKDQLCVMNPENKACPTSNQGTASKPQ